MVTLSIPLVSRAGVGGSYRVLICAQPHSLSEQSIVQALQARFSCIHADQRLFLSQRLEKIETDFHNAAVVADRITHAHTSVIAS